ELGYGGGAVEFFGGFVLLLRDHAGFGFLVAGDNGEEEVFAGAVVHLPERDGGGVGDLRLVVVEGGAEFFDELRVLGFVCGKDGCCADVHIVAGDGLADEVFGARVDAHGAERGHGLDAVVLRLVGSGGAGKHGPGAIDGGGRQRI